MSSGSVHLLVLIHGMWGRPTHLSELARIIRETKSQPSSDGVQLHVLIAETNREESTYDGVDWGGERVTDEIMEEVAKLKNDGKNVVRFSVTGYSLGGLLARYIVGILHQREFFKRVTPVNFNTIATPHIGVPRYPSIISSLFSTLGQRLLSRTGQQFYCADQWSTSGKPLLEIMADPERIFYRSLALFEHIRIYANAVNDRTVPYVTSAIEIDDPFADFAWNGVQIELDDRYSPLVKSYTLPTSPPTPTPKPTLLSLSWFKGLKPNRPILPPALQLRFPLNIAIYILLPLLIPFGILFAIIRLSLATRSSRTRIRLLEKDESKGPRLIHILTRFEKQVEDAVTDIIDDSALSGSLQRYDPERIMSNPPVDGKTKHPPTRPILTPLQKSIVLSLNKLPMKKELAYIQALRNSHGIIVCRDVKRFEEHRIGEGIVRHWADVFIL